MADNTQITQTGFTHYVDGLLVNETNLDNDAGSAVNHDGEVLAALLGALDVYPAYNPAVFTTPGISGTLSSTIGGFGSDGAPQMLFLQGRLIDYIPVQTFITPSASGAGSTRIDLVAAKFTTASISGLIPEQYVQASNGANNLQQIGLDFNSILWDYVTGTPGGGQPATPAGYEAFATITMTGGATHVGPITYLFPTPAQALAGGGLVSSLNGEFGSVTISGGPGITITKPTSQIIEVSFSATPVVSVNGETGAISIIAGTGISVTQPSGSQIEITNTAAATTINGESGAITIAVSAPLTLTESPTGTFTIGTTLTETSVNALSGAITLNSANSIISVGTAGSTITLTATAVASLNGQTGAVSLVDDSGVLPVSTSGGNVHIGFSGVASIGSVAGTVTLSSTSGTVSVTPSGSNLDINMVATPIGSTYSEFCSTPSGSWGCSVALPAAGTFDVLVEQVWNSSDGSGTAGISGIGGLATGPTTAYLFALDNAPAVSEFIAAVGTATGGSTITVNGTSSDGTGTTTGLVKITATRKT